MRFFLAAAALASLTACQSTADVPTVGGDRIPAEAVALDVEDPADLASRLRALGLDLPAGSYSVSNARAAAGLGYTLSGGGTLFVFEYPTREARDADIPALTEPDAGGPPVSVYTAADRFAVVYSGVDAEVRATLADALDPVAAAE